MRYAKMARWIFVLIVWVEVVLPTRSPAEPVLRLPQDLTSCPADMVRVGPVCVDIYEASVWSSPDGTGTQYGLQDSDYPCEREGSDCTNIFAVSRAGVRPSTEITWFQAQQGV